MWNEKQMIEYMKKNLKENRFNHSISVRDTAEKLALHYKVDVKKARIAGLVHDCAKNMSDKELIFKAKEYGYNIEEIYLLNPSILHGLVGSFIARDMMGIEDEDILNAIIYHTTGRTNMSILEKIIYISDYIEPLRNFKEVQEVRDITYENLDKAILKCFDNTIKYVVLQGGALHTDTIEARNSILLHMYLTTVQKESPLSSISGSQNLLLK